MRVRLALCCSLFAASVQGQPAWTLSASPTLDIGSESRVHTQFNGVTGVLTMPSGELVVANGLSQELRVFSSSGEYLRTLAPNGEVEMRSLDRLWRGAGDTIYAAELTPTENSVWTFTLAGFVSKRAIGASNAGGVYPLGRFPDGSFAVSAAPRHPGRAPFGMTFVDSQPLGVVSPGELAPKWFGSLRNEMLITQGYGRGRGGGARTTVPYRYGRNTSYAISGARLWIGDSETGTITQYNSDGRGLSVFNAPLPPRPLDTAAIRRARMSGRPSVMNWNDRLEIDAAYAVPFRRSAPRFTRFLPGINGEVWIGVFREDPLAPRSYVVVDRTGAPIGRVTMPPHVVPMEVRATDVTAVLIDGEGLEHVVRYALRRNRP